MLVTIPFHSGDAQQAGELLLWMEQLGGNPNHEVVLFADGDVDWGIAIELITVAERVFKHASIISTEQSVKGWPQGANSLFWKAAEHCQRRDEPFLWLEPDCVPLSRDWLERIQAQYKDGYLGHIYECNQPGLPHRLLSGIAVYPPNAFEVISPYIGNEPHRAWDVSAAEKILESAKDSHLFHHFWGTKESAPTFVARKSDRDPINALTLDHIRKGAVLFHRNKDGTLRRLMAAKLGIAPLTNFVVVLPVCNSDCELMSRLLDWIAALGGANTHEALLSFDNSTTRGVISRLVSKASQCFLKVHETFYGVPRGTRFPQTAAWQHAARTMEAMHRPWLWLEADCVPLKANWLKMLQDEYNRCGKPFCGPVVQGREHFNGTAIYPADTPARMPRTMSHTNNAWDVECVDEVRGQVHDCRHLWQLAWGVLRGNQLDELSGEEPPTFPRNSPLLRQIRPQAVIFHRDKSGTLIQRLSESI